MSSGAEQAFEQLRAEVTVMRRIIEELQRAIEAVPTVDYSPTLGEIAGAQQHIAANIEVIAKAAGALSHRERMMRELVWARDTALSPALDALTAAQREATSVVQMIRQSAGIARVRNEQRQAVKVALAGGVALGLLAYPLAVKPTVETMAGLWQAKPPSEQER